MADGVFQFEDCLLKHFIRHDVWLPNCRKRLKALQQPSGKTKKASRRLKYFTFCAVGALDVLLLDREKILKRSALKEFDTVYFFDRDEEAVIETRKRIPGAIGFPGDFIKIVIETAEGAGLESPADSENTREVRQAQVKQAQLGKFLEAFPFDVLNLDVEQYLFRPKEALPGKLMTALRNLFEWQKREAVDGNGKKYVLDEFTLMFTTQVGPSNLPDDYIQYLRDTCLQQNMNQFDELKEPFLKKSEGKDAAQFFAQDFAGAFKLAVPKSLIELALESDWHLDGEQSVDVYQFDRPSQDGPYCMLHMTMTVRRQMPVKEKRAPGQKVPAVQDEHRKAIKYLFERDVVVVESLVVGDKKDKLDADLQSLFEHRKKYYQPPDVPA